MKIQAINCDYLFNKDLIEEIKSNIEDYHQGFMIVNDTLYMPIYVAFERNYKLPSKYKLNIIDSSDVTDFDDMASYFYNVTTLSADDVIDLYNHQCDFEELLNIVDDIAEFNYQQGYTQGYDEGDEDGYNKCYHFNKEYK